MGRGFHIKVPLVEVLLVQASLVDFLHIEASMEMSLVWIA